MIKVQTGYAFAYNSEIISTQKRIVCNFPPNTEIDYILKHVIPATVSYSRKGKYVILYSSIPPKNKYKTKALIKFDSSSVHSDVKLNDSLPNLKKNNFSMADTANSQVVSKMSDSLKTVMNSPKIKLPRFTYKKKSLFVGGVVLSTYDKLVDVSIHAGYKRYYGILFYSSDFNTYNWYGLGVGSNFLIYYGLDVSMEALYNILCGGTKFESGVIASAFLFRPSIGYNLGAFRFFVGPQLFIRNEQTNDQGTPISVQTGYNINYGIKIDLTKLFDKR